MPDFENDFERRIPDEPMIEEWPDPEEYEDAEDVWDDYEDEGPMDYEVKFKLRHASVEQLNSISRYLFEVISKEFAIDYDQLEELEIEED